MSANTITTMRGGVDYDSARATEILNWVNTLPFDELLACAEYAETLPTGDSFTARTAVRKALPAPARTLANEWASRIYVAGRIVHGRAAERQIAGLPAEGRRRTASAPSDPMPASGLTTAVANALLDIVAQPHDEVAPSAGNLTHAYGRVREFHDAFAPCTAEQRTAVLKLVPGTSGENIRDLVAALLATDLI